MSLHPVVAPAPAVFCFESHEVRTVEKEGETWFVAKDVADILGYVNQPKAIRMHCKHAAPVGVPNSVTPHDLDQQTMIIQEGDIYRLIVRSTMPIADKFERWLMDEVIPSIRRHGHYSAAPVKQLPVSTDPLDLFLITSNAIQQITEETDARIDQVEDMTLTTATKLDDFLDTRPLLPHQCHAVQKAVAEKVSSLGDKYRIYNRLLFSSIYGFIKRHFNVNTYSAIASARFDEAVAVIKNLSLTQLPETVQAKAKGGAA